MTFFFFVILLSIDGFFLCFFRHFVYFSYFQTFYLQSLLPAVPPNAGRTIKKEPLISPGNTSFRKHKRVLFFFCSLFCFFLLFWNNNIQYNRRNSCRNNTGAAENQLDIIRKLKLLPCGNQGRSQTQSTETIVISRLVIGSL